MKPVEGLHLPDLSRLLALARLCQLCGLQFCRCFDLLELGQANEFRTIELLRLTFALAEERGWAFHDALAVVVADVCC